jgi:hypothetical protein
VTPIYRCSCEAPPFGKGTFWTETQAQAAELGKLETGVSDLSAFRLYGADEPMDPFVSRDLQEQVPEGEAREGSRLRAWIEQDVEREPSKPR